MAAVVAAICFVSPARAQDAQSLTMHQAITLALQNSRDLKLARVQYNVAANEAGVDRAAFRPNLYTGAGLAYTHGFPSLPGGGAPSVFQLDYQQTLFDPWLKGQQKAAEDRAKNQKLEMDHVRDNVIVRTATEYLELAKVQHSLDLMRTERTSAEKILEALRERVAANQELPIELTRSQLALARMRPPPLPPYSRRPPPAGRSSRGLATLTVRARPPSCEPLSAAMAFCASSGEFMVTKPKPRGRPVVRSIIRLVSTTVPCAAKASCRSFSVVSKERFPTNNLLLM